MNSNSKEMKYLYVSVPKFPDTTDISIETIMQLLETKERDEYLILVTDSGYWKATPKKNFTPTTSIDWVDTFADIVEVKKCILSFEEATKLATKWGWTLPTKTL